MGWQLDDGTPVHIFGEHKFDKAGDYIILNLEEMEKHAGIKITNVLFMQSKQSIKRYLIGTEMREAKKEEKKKTKKKSKKKGEKNEKPNKQRTGDKKEKGK